jgi:hypothetical protein
MSKDIHYSAADGWKRQCSLMNGGEVFARHENGNYDLQRQEGWD